MPPTRLTHPAVDCWCAAPPTRVGVPVPLSQRRAAKNFHAIHPDCRPILHTPKAIPTCIAPLVMIALVAGGTLNSSAAYLSTAVKGASSGTLKLCDGPVSHGNTRSQQRALFFQPSLHASRPKTFRNPSTSRSGAHTDAEHKRPRPRVKGAHVSSRGASGHPPRSWAARTSPDCDNGCVLRSTPRADEQGNSGSARTSRATQAALVPTWRGHLPQPAAQLQGVGRGRAEGMPDRWSGPNASHAAAQQPRTRPQGSARAPAARLPSRATYILKGSLGSDVSVTLNVTLDMAPAPTPAPNHLRARQTAAGRASSGARCAQRRRRSCRRGR